MHRNWKTNEMMSSAKSNLTNIFIAGIVGVQLAFLFYILVMSGPSDLESFDPPTANNYLIIQTDDTGQVMQKWDIEKANFINHGGAWTFRTEKSRVVLSPMKHYIFLENPTKEERKRFLSVDKE